MKSDIYVEEIKEILANKFGVGNEEINTLEKEEDIIQKFNLDSISMVEFVIEIEEILGGDLSEIFVCVPIISIENIVNYIDNMGERDGNI